MTNFKLPDNMGDLGKQFDKMKQGMVEVQEQLANETVEVTAGGGAITIVITGHQRIQSIEILPEAINSEEPENLQDMLVAAVNNAIERSQLMAAQRLQGLTGDLDVPGLDLSSLGS